MGYFSKKDNSLIFTANGEVVELSPWGKNSLRTRASFFGGIKEGEIALLEPEYTKANIEPIEVLVQPRTYPLLKY